MGLDEGKQGSRKAGGSSVKVEAGGAGLPKGPMALSTRSPSCATATAVSLAFLGLVGSFTSLSLV